MWSLSPNVTAEPNPNIKETSPSKRSMMISKCRKVWSWLNEPRETPLGDHDRITIDYQLIMHPVSGEDHVTPWRSTKLNRKENMPQYGIRCVVGQKIKWHQIIYHQACNPSHPCPQLNQINRSKKRILEGKVWWYPNAEKCESYWMAEESFPWEIMIR